MRTTDAAVSEITRLCGYLPLAIGMLASQLRHHPAWTATGLAADLAAARDRLALMRAESRAKPSHGWTPSAPTSRRSGRSSIGGQPTAGRGGDSGELAELLHAVWLAKKIIELVCSAELAQAAQDYVRGTR
jgi:hypothetical protein